MNNLTFIKQYSNIVQAKEIINVETDSSTGFAFFKLVCFLFVSNKVGHVQEIKLKEGMKHQLITKSLRPLLFGK